METFSELLAICAGNTPVTGEFPARRRVTRSFDVFFDLRLNKWLSKQSWDWWFETLSRPLWRHCHGIWRHGGDHIRMYTGPTFEGLTLLCCWYKMLKAKKPTMICCVLSRLICQSLLCHHILSSLRLADSYMSQLTNYWHNGVPRNISNPFSTNMKRIDQTIRRKLCVKQCLKHCVGRKI